MRFGQIRAGDGQIISKWRTISLECPVYSCYLAVSRVDYERGVKLEP